MLVVALGYLILVQLLIFVTQNRSCGIKRRLAKDEVTMRVGNGSKVDVITVGTLPLHLPLGLVLDLNNCYLVPALSMKIISGSCLMRDGYSFKLENNGCSIYMDNIFYGHAPLLSGLFLLNLDCDDTHVHNMKPKDAKLIMIVQLICGTVVWVISV